MGEYEDTIKDIEESLGIVPGFMKALPKEALIQDWPLFKRYTLEETDIPAKYRELMSLAVAANLKCPYCQLF
ncbi:MAG: carboxymuconolactone decarboxylase family protein, partial [Methanococcoides sp.]|nr:carboxymuconolactone decarboxylase family protein [Methanococcoides sp.]